jgi:hypothetical protein
VFVDVLPELTARRFLTLGAVGYATLLILA